MLALAALAAGSLVGCKKKQDARRQEWLDTATACPAPAACTGKMNAAAREVSVCEPSPDTKSLQAGDVVVTKELGGAHRTVGRIEKPKAGGTSFDVEFPDGFVLERSAADVVARVCR